MITSELVSKIYYASIETSKWPELLEAVSKELDSNSKLNSATHSLAASVNGANLSIQTSVHSVQEEWVQGIQAHLNRAALISAELTKKDNQEGNLHFLLEQIIVPAIMIESDLTLVGFNQLAKPLFNQNKLVSLQTDKIRLNNFKAQRQLSNALTDSVQNTLTSNLVYIRLSDVTDAVSGTLLVMKTESTSSSYLLMFASFDSNLHIDENKLKQVFGLTKSESSLLNYLVNGHSLSEIATKRHVSLNTLRTQLKSAFAKTNTNRQAELIKLALTSPYLLSYEASEPKNDDNIDYHAKQLNQQISLRDGRKLGFAEFGDLSGEPVFVFHPLTGSRLQGHPNNNIAKQLKARIIIPDRPGFGLSSELKGRTLLDWPSDIKELANALKLKKFSIVGFCGGAPYALSCAYSIPERLKAVSVVSGVTPFDNINLLHGVPTANKLLIKLAVQLPNTLFGLVSIMMRSLVKRPERYLDHVLEELCKTDQQALAEPELIENFTAALGQTFKQGPKAFTDEQLINSTDWPFNVNKIQMPIKIWHGDEDKHVDISLSNRLANTLPNGTINVMEGYGHFLIYHRWADILDDCLQRVKGL